MFSNLRIGHGYDATVWWRASMYHRRGRHSLRARPAGPLGCRCARACLADAILGVPRGDIGRLFPDTDPAYEGADSMVLLARVMDYARELA